MLCDFVVRFDITEHPGDELRALLPLLLAATGFALAFDGFPEPQARHVGTGAGRRDCVFEVPPQPRPLIEQRPPGGDVQQDHVGR